MNAYTKNVEPILMAFVEQKGIENIDDTYHKLIYWAENIELLNPKELNAIRIFHDSFKDTATDQIRMDLGLILEYPMKEAFPVKFKEFTPKKCFIQHVELDLSELGDAWKNHFIAMREQGLSPSGEKPFEIIHNNYLEHPTLKCIAELYIPINE